MLQEPLRKLVNRSDLTAEEAEAVLQDVMTGQATEAQIGGLLVAMRMKGETADEIAGFARAMRRHCVPVSPRVDGLVDTCGTGGDALDTFNISTAAALVAAGAGVPVAKHGNRAVSSQCGSADVLGELGVNLELSTDAVSRCIEEVGIGFLFAPRLHPAMRHAAGPRRELALRTVFNLLGPLTNPANAQRQVIGVCDPTAAPNMAAALRAMGSEHVLLVHGAVGLDEIALTGATYLTELREGAIRQSVVTATDLGLPEVALADITGGPPREAAAILRRVLEGEPGPRQDIVLANAAAAIYVSGRCGSLREGVGMARLALESGAAAAKLAALKDLSWRLA